MPSSSFLKPKGLSGTLLIIDDDRTMRTMLCMQLEDLDYDIVEAASGNEALELLSGQDFEVDAILLDRTMPGLDGMEFLQALKKLRRLKHIPVIMITGSGQAAEVSDGIEAGVFYYLVKPVDYSVLISVVSSAVAESRHAQRISLYQRQYTHIFSLLEEGCIVLETFQQAEIVSAALALAFPDPQRVLNGLGALLANAVSQNASKGAEDKPNPAKKVEVLFTRHPDNAMVTIRNHGPGFDWHGLENSDVKNDVLRAVQLSFDAVAYNNAGNEVTAIISLSGYPTNVAR